MTTTNLFYQLLENNSSLDEIILLENNNPDLIPNIDFNQCFKITQHTHNFTHLEHLTKLLINQNDHHYNLNTPFSDACIHSDIEWITYLFSIMNTYQQKFEAKNSLEMKIYLNYRNNIFKPLYEKIVTEIISSNNNQFCIELATLGNEEISNKTFPYVFLIHALIENNQFDKFVFLYSNLTEMLPHTELAFTYSLNHGNELFYTYLTPFLSKNVFLSRDFDQTYFYQDSLNSIAYGGNIHTLHYFTSYFNIDLNANTDQEKLLGNRAITASLLAQQIDMLNTLYKNGARLYEGLNLSQLKKTEIERQTLWEDIIDCKTLDSCLDNLSYNIYQYEPTMFPSFIKEIEQCLLTKNVDYVLKKWQQFEFKDKIESNLHLKTSNSKHKI